MLTTEITPALKLANSDKDNQRDMVGYIHKTVSKNYGRRRIRWYVGDFNQFNLPEGQKHRTDHETATDL